MVNTNGNRNVTDNCKYPNNNFIIKMTYTNEIKYTAIL